jgi:hypothetical protein
MAKKTPKLDRPLTDNPAEAEVDTNIYFEWRGLPLVVDITAVKFGAWSYAMRRVQNENLLILDRINAAIDIFEATIGEEQLAAVAAHTPNLFDDSDTLSSFWEAFIVAVKGVKPGESSAS